jgi:hypothetical protein
LVHIAMKTLLARLERRQSNQSPIAQLKLEIDTVLKSEDEVSVMKSASTTASPRENRLSNAKDAEDNIGGRSGSMAYFVTVVPIAQLLAPELFEQISADAVMMAKSQRPFKRRR